MKVTGWILNPAKADHVQPPDARRVPQGLPDVTRTFGLLLLQHTYNSATANMARPSKKQQAREEESDHEDEFVNEEEEDDIEGDGPPAVDPYAVLGLETEASADDVKKAYRKLALKHHPGTYHARTSI